ncbi:hypothetical protein [Paracoccus fontiphilus]|uniref:Uncharacterized protein n=1 Tax=Paracoccus fontiphilus TaxID=1815556 RepID=A0ABV7II48_9RHOB|nr:hypothetical protein [Paracoccus fontiphilus]
MHDARTTIQADVSPAIPIVHPLVAEYVGGTAPSPAMRRALQEVLPAPPPMGNRALFSGSGDLVDW